MPSGLTISLSDFYYILPELVLTAVHWTRSPDARVHIEPHVEPRAKPELSA